MGTFITPAPHAEPATTDADPPAVVAGTAATAVARTRTPCARRPHLHAPRRVPHRGAVAAVHRDAHVSAASRTGTPVDIGCRPFAEVTLRTVLEVLDRRRHPTALRPMLATGPFDLVAALTRAGTPGRRLGSARLRRVHVQPGGPDHAEIFGTYARGDRAFAIAGRVERTPAARRRTGGGWMITSLQVG